MASVSRDFWSKVDALPKKELENLNRKPFINEMMTNVYKNISNCIADFSIMNKDKRKIKLENMGEQRDNYTFGLQSWLTYKAFPISNEPVIMKTNRRVIDHKTINIGSLNLGDIPFLQREYDGKDYLFHCELVFSYYFGRDYSYFLDVNGKKIKAKHIQKSNRQYYK